EARAGARARAEGHDRRADGKRSGFQFTIATTLVKGDSTTAIRGGGDTSKTFADLKNGLTVEVRGVQREGFVQARRIEIEGPEDEPGDDEVEVEGTLGPVTGTCPAISSSVGSTKFMTSSSTKFEGAACGAFKQ